MAEVVIGNRTVGEGDRVVYPNGGICRVRGVESKDIGGQSWVMLMLEREEDGATVMVPKDKIESIGLRKVASSEAIDALFELLTSSSADPELDWKVRYRENSELMAAGGLLDTATVLKGLHALARLRPLPQRERELYDSARHQLVGEISASLGLPPAVAENNIDYALDPPPGSGRMAPADAPIDLKSLRKSAPKTRRADSEELEEELEGGEDDEELLGTVADEEGDELLEDDGELSGDAEEDEESPKAAASGGKAPAAKKAASGAGAAAIASKSAKKGGSASKASASTAAKKPASKKAAPKKAAAKKSASKTSASKASTSKASASKTAPNSSASKGNSAAGSALSASESTSKSKSESTAESAASNSKGSPKAAGKASPGARKEKAEAKTDSKDNSKTRSKTSSKGPAKSRAASARIAADKTTSTLSGALAEASESKGNS